MTILDDVKALGAVLYQTGSSVICPDGVIHDIDYVVLSETNLQEGLIKLGFIRTTKEEYPMQQMPQFVAYRLNGLNLITTMDKELFARFKDATEIAISRKLCNKADRITLFQKVLYDNG